MRRPAGSSLYQDEGAEKGRHMPVFGPSSDNHADNHGNMVLKIRYKEINHKINVKKKTVDNLLERYVFMVFLREDDESGTFGVKMRKS